jgi:hypothetical protein
MSGLTYHSWVKPTADLLATDRAEVIAFARGAALDFWDRPSIVDRWQNRDLLAHLAGGNDQLFQTLLRAATGRVLLDPATLDPDTDAENASRIAERRTWSINDLITELERDGAEIQDLLAALTEDDEHRQFKGFSLTLGQFIAIVHHERHDHEHLLQLRANRSP